MADIDTLKRALEKIGCEVTQVDYPDEFYPIDELHKSDPAIAELFPEQEVQTEPPKPQLREAAHIRLDLGDSYFVFDVDGNFLETGCSSCDCEGIGSRPC